MDFKDYFKQLQERISKLKGQIETEEATKNAFIMPFIQMLGYDVFNPTEVVPEMVCDIGAKKGEKIDYAIIKDGEPIILIECKHWKQNLNLHDNQLLRYFNVSKAKFGILTNGIKYRFYTDLSEPNKMDSTPFLEIDFENVKEQHIEDLKKFHNTYFDVSTILNSASELKYTSELKIALNKEFTNPSPEFVKLLSKQVYDGVITPRLLEQFSALVKKSITNHINDLISDRLNIAIKTTEPSAIGDSSAEIVEELAEDPKNRIETTDEEVEAFYIIKSILRSKINADRIAYRDTLSYFSVLVDDNNRKPLCRIYLNSPTNKQLVCFDDDKKEIKNKISCIDDIYEYSELLIKTAEKYIE
ncbi:MAG: type I restriction endonuclease [Rikenellaceae bacterium]